ncbi:MAG: DUF4468 domain-containing protein [Bacteroidetes bacterium]|nr:DUF4468 domain-containing protein [Bacteroidota bacterium]
MRTVLVLLSLCLAWCCPAQGTYNDSLLGKPVWKVKALPLDGSDIVYSGHESLSFPRDLLFKNALDWYNVNYKTVDTKLTVENKETGTVSGTGIIHFKQAAVANGPENIFFSFTIQLTNTGYDYRIYGIYSMLNGEKIWYSDMYREETAPSPEVKPHWTHRYRYEVISNMDEFMQLAINQLKASMANSK